MFHALLLGAALSVGQAAPIDPNAPPPGRWYATVGYAEAAEGGAAADQAPAKEPVQINAPLLPPPAPPAAAPAAAAPGAASPPWRWILMRELQGTWPGSVMDTERVSVYGWTEMSFTASTTDDTNAPMSWNDQANKFLMQQTYVRINRSVVTTGTTTPTYGGEVDMIFGTDYRYTLPQRGLLYSQRFENNGTFYLYGFDPVQFYGEAYYPTIGRGLDVKVGRFYTPYGTESIDAVLTPLVSRAYTFSNGSPFTHTGVLGTLTVTPVWTVQAGLVAGSDIFISDGDRPTFIGTVQFTQPGGRNIVKGTTILGDAKFEQDLSVNNINVFDVTWTHLFSNPPNSYSTLHPEWTMPVPSPGLSYQFESLYGYQAGAPLPSGRTGTATWYSMVHYMNYQFGPRASVTGRLEFFEDSQGQRTGFPGLYTAPAVCLTYKPRPSLILRPEIRYDYNDESKAFDGHHGLATATADVILRW